MNTDHSYTKAKTDAGEKRLARSYRSTLIITLNF